MPTASPSPFFLRRQMIIVGTALCSTLLLAFVLLLSPLPSPPATISDAGAASGMLHPSSPYAAGERGGGGSRAVKTGDIRVETDIRGEGPSSLPSSLPFTATDPTTALNTEQYGGTSAVHSNSSPPHRDASTAAAAGVVAPTTSTAKASANETSGGGAIDTAPYCPFCRCDRLCAAKLLVTLRRQLFEYATTATSSSSYDGRFDFDLANAEKCSPALPHRQRQVGEEEGDDVEDQSALILQILPHFLIGSGRGDTSVPPTTNRKSPTGNAQNTSKSEKNDDGGGGAQGANDYFSEVQIQFETFDVYAHMKRKRRNIHDDDGDNPTATAAAKAPLRTASPSPPIVYWNWLTPSPSPRRGPLVGDNNSRTMVKNSDEAERREAEAFDQLSRKFVLWTLADSISTDKKYNDDAVDGDNSSDGIDIERRAHHHHHIENPPTRFPSSLAAAANNNGQQQQQQQQQQQETLENSILDAIGAVVEKLSLPMEKWSLNKKKRTTSSSNKEEAEVEAETFLTLLHQKEDGRDLLSHQRALFQTLMAAANTLASPSRYDHRSLVMADSEVCGGGDEEEDDKTKNSNSDDEENDGDGKTPKKQSAAPATSSPPLSPLRPIISRVNRANTIGYYHRDIQYLELMERWSHRQATEKTKAVKALGEVMMADRGGREGNGGGGGGGGGESSSHQQQISSLEEEREANKKKKRSLLAQIAYVRRVYEKASEHKQLLLGMVDAMKKNGGGGGASPSPSSSSTTSIPPQKGGSGINPSTITPPYASFSAGAVVRTRRTCEWASFTAIADPFINLNLFVRNRNNHNNNNNRNRGGGGRSPSTTTSGFLTHHPNAAKILSDAASIVVNAKGVFSKMDGGGSNSTTTTTLPSSMTTLVASPAPPVLSHIFWINDDHDYDYDIATMTTTTSTNVTTALATSSSSFHDNHNAPPSPLPRSPIHTSAHHFWNSGLSGRHLAPLGNVFAIQPQTTLAVLSAVSSILSPNSNAAAASAGIGGSPPPPPPYLNHNSLGASVQKFLSADPRITNAALDFLANNRQPNGPRSGHAFINPFSSASSSGSGHANHFEMVAPLWIPTQAMAMTDVLTMPWVGGSGRGGGGGNHDGNGNNQAKGLGDGSFPDASSDSLLRDAPPYTPYTLRATPGVLKTLLESNGQRHVPILLATNNAAAAAAPSSSESHPYNATSANTTTTTTMMTTEEEKKKTTQKDQKKSTYNVSVGLETMMMCVESQSESEQSGLCPFLVLFRESDERRWGRKMGVGGPMATSAAQHHSMLLAMTGAATASDASTESEKKENQLQQQQEEEEKRSDLLPRGPTAYPATPSLLAAPFESALSDFKVELSRENVEQLLFAEAKRKKKQKGRRRQRSDGDSNNDAAADEESRDESREGGGSIKPPFSSSASSPSAYYGTITIPPFVNVPRCSSTSSVLYIGTSHTRFLLTMHCAALGNSKVDGHDGDCSQISKMKHHILTRNMKRGRNENKNESEKNSHGSSTTTHHDNSSDSSSSSSSRRLYAPQDVAIAYASIILNINQNRGSYIASFIKELVGWKRGGDNGEKSPQQKSSNIAGGGGGGGGSKPSSSASSSERSTPTAATIEDEMLSFGLTRDDLTYAAQFFTHIVFSPGAWEIVFSDLSPLDMARDVAETILLLQTLFPRAKVLVYNMHYHHGEGQFGRSSLHKRSVKNLNNNAVNGGGSGATAVVVDESKLRRPPDALVAAAAIVSEPSSAAPLTSSSSSSFSSPLAYTQFLRTLGPDAGYHCRRPSRVAMFRDGILCGTADAFIEQYVSEGQFVLPAWYEAAMRREGTAPRNRLPIPPPPPPQQQQRPDHLHHEVIDFWSPSRDTTARAFSDASGHHYTDVVLEGMLMRLLRDYVCAPPRRIKMTIYYAEKGDEEEHQQQIHSPPNTHSHPPSSPIPIAVVKVKYDALKWQIATTTTTTPPSQHSSSIRINSINSSSAISSINSSALNPSEKEEDDPVVVRRITVGDGDSDGEEEKAALFARLEAADERYHQRHSYDSSSPSEAASTTSVAMSGGGGRFDAKLVYQHSHAAKAAASSLLSSPPSSPPHVGTSREPLLSDAMPLLPLLKRPPRAVGAHMCRRLYYDYTNETVYNNIHRRRNTQRRKIGGDDGDDGGRTATQSSIRPFSPLPPPYRREERCSTMHQDYATGGGSGSGGATLHQQAAAAAAAQHSSRPSHHHLLIPVDDILYELRDYYKLGPPDYYDSDRRHFT